MPSHGRLRAKGVVLHVAANRVGQGGRVEPATRVLLGLAVLASVLVAAALDKGSVSPAAQGAG